MPQDSSNAGTEPEGITVLLNCRGFSDESVRVYIPCRIPNVRRKTLRKYNLLMEESNRAWTTDIIRNQIIDLIIFRIFYFIKYEILNGMGTSPETDDLINGKDNDSCQPYPGYGLEPLWRPYILTLSLRNERQRTR